GQPFGFGHGQDEIGNEGTNLAAVSTPIELLQREGFIYATECAHGSLHRGRHRRSDCVLHPSSGRSSLRPIGSILRHPRARGSAARAEPTERPRWWLATDAGRPKT